MDKFLKIGAAVLLALFVIAMIADDDDIGDNLEEAANDAGREIEDATEEVG
jgi:hypothetical protein